MKKVIFILFLSSSTVFSQEVDIRPFSLWFTMLNKYQFHEKWSVSMETHERFDGFFARQGNFLWRPSVDYNFNDVVIGSVGYTYITTQAIDPADQTYYPTENNLWEQAIIKHRFEKSELQHRLRQEHRWSEQEFGNGYSFSNRFRYRLTYLRGLKTLKNNDGIFMHAFDELWLNQGSGILPQNFARNWIYLGLGYAFTPDMNVQTGFMHQLDRQGEGTFVVRPIWQSTFVWNF